MDGNFANCVGARACLSFGLVDKVFSTACFDYGSSSAYYNPRGATCYKCMLTFILRNTEMKTLFLSIFLLLAPASNAQYETCSSETYVYICTGPQSKRYHKTNECRGLSSCSKDIKKVTISYAKNIGRTPCHWCYQ